MKIYSLCAISAALAFPVVSGHAQTSIPINNPSFETPTANANSTPTGGNGQFAPFAAGNYTGSDTGTAGPLLLSSLAGIGAGTSDGLQVLGVADQNAAAGQPHVTDYGVNNGSSGNVLSGTSNNYGFLGTFTLGTTYQLTVAVASANPLDGFGIDLLSVATGGTAGSTTATPAFSIVSSSAFNAFAAGGPNFGSTQYAGDPATGAPNTFTDLTITYTATAATAGTNIGFDLSYENQPGVNGVGYFDNVRLSETTGVPEPSTWMAMLVGVGALLGVQRLRRSVA